MTCDRCPHLKEVKNALAPCQNCDAGRLGGTCHIDEARMDYALANHAAAIRAEATAATMLAPEVEDAMRKVLATFAELKLIDAPILLGLLKGVTIAEVARELGMSRQAAHARLKSALRRCPWVSALHTRSECFIHAPPPAVTTTVTRR